MTAVGHCLAVPVHSLIDIFLATDSAGPVVKQVSTMQWGRSATTCHCLAHVFGSL